MARRKGLLFQSDDFLAKPEASIYSCFITRLELAYPRQVPIRRHTNQQLVVDVLIDLKLRMALEPLMNGRFGIVADVPGAIGEGAGG